MTREDAQLVLLAATHRRLSLPTDADLIIVGCCKGKRAGDDRVPAADLYTSDLFRKRRAYAEATGKRWLILSALHGIVEPLEPIPPYDCTLSDLKCHQLAGLKWAMNRKLQRLSIARNSLVEIHAGADYVALLKGDSYRQIILPLRFRVPLAGLGIGQQLAEYVAVLRAMPAAIAPTPATPVRETVFFERGPRGGLRRVKALVITGATLTPKGPDHGTQS